MYQESAGVRVSIPTSVLDLIPWMEDSERAEGRGGEGVRVGLGRPKGARRAPLLVHFLFPTSESGVVTLSVPNVGIGFYRIIGWMYQEGGECGVDVGG